MPHWQREMDRADRADREEALSRRDEGGVLLSVSLPDRLLFQGQRHFTLAGRLDEAVQVGGINVFPSRVAQLLRQHPEVAQAAERLMSALEGDRLKAFLVPARFHAGRAATAQQPGQVMPLGAWRCGHFGLSLP
jgi:hypothetical protein